MTNELADDVLGRSLDELAPQTRRFLEQVLEMVKAESARQEMDPRQYRFTRREAREYTRQSNTITRKHLERLIELEYIVVHHGTNGQQFVYELVYRGEGNEKRKFLMGLLDVNELAERGGDTTMTPNLAPQNGHLAPTLRPAGAHLAPTLHPDNFDPTLGSEVKIITLFENPPKTHVTREKKASSYSYTKTDNRTDRSTPAESAAGEARAPGAPASDGRAADGRGDRAPEGEARGVSAAEGSASGAGPGDGRAEGECAAEGGDDAGEADDKGAGADAVGEQAPGEHRGEDNDDDFAAPMASAV